MGMIGNSVISPSEFWKTSTLCPLEFSGGTLGKMLVSDGKE
jgi:hypothetical protein